MSGIVQKVCPASISVCAVSISMSTYSSSEKLLGESIPVEFITGNDNSPGGASCTSLSMTATVAGTSAAEACCFFRKCIHVNIKPTQTTAATKIPTPRPTPKPDFPETFCLVFVGKLMVAGDGEGANVTLTSAIGRVASELSLSSLFDERSVFGGELSGS